MTPEEQRRQISEEKKRAQTSKYRSGIASKEANPCFHEQELSMKCLNSTEREKQDEMCKLYFENYKRCKLFWLRVQMDRRRKGIQPELPPLEEREKIKAQFLRQ